MIGVAALAALAAATSCQDPASPLQCPDLVIAPATALRAERTPSGRRVVLRMANRIVNVGAGPLEFVGRRVSSREMVAKQVLTDAAGARYRVTTGGELYYTSVPSRGGSYWKFQNAARFELWTMDATGKRETLVRVGPKLNYCFRDLERARFDSEVEHQPTFGACNQRAAKREVTLGTSVGWADVYPASYPGNWIDVTGLSGCFAVVQRVDPERHVIESDETNNVSERIVRLPYRPGLPSGCPGASV
ncbi:MAG: hypothetical protein QOG35_742 [Solirubrobacteraceae bacterium]|nr:hypothetical protein [Solirubrobacteraceae bacterium]